MKYKDIIITKKKTYIYQKFLINSSRHNTLKLSMDWDEERFIIRSAEIFNGEEYIKIPKIYIFDEEIAKEEKY